MPLQSFNVMQYLGLRITGIISTSLAYYISIRLNRWLALMLLRFLRIGLIFVLLAKRSIRSGAMNNTLNNEHAPLPLYRVFRTRYVFLHIYLYILHSYSVLPQPTRCIGFPPRPITPCVLCTPVSVLQLCSTM